MKDCFPFWERLTANESTELETAALVRSVEAGAAIHTGSADCDGLIAVMDGQIRAFILSPEGRELTLYRLVSGDICLFSATCAVSGLRFDVSVEAEKSSRLWVIPPAVCKRLVARSLVFANFIGEIAASHLSDILWLVEQVLWKSFDARLAEFLMKESELEGTKKLKITHEKIAAHLGTAREVVTRMLRYFQSEGMVCLSRGCIEILAQEKMERLTAKK